MVDRRRRPSLAKVLGTTFQSTVNWKRGFLLGISLSCLLSTTTIKLQHHRRSSPDAISGLRTNCGFEQECTFSNSIMRYPAHIFGDDQHLPSWGTARFSRRYWYRKISNHVYHKLEAKFNAKQTYTHRLIGRYQISIVIVGSSPNRSEE